MERVISILRELNSDQIHALRQHVSKRSLLEYAHTNWLIVQCNTNPKATEERIKDRLVTALGSENCSIFLEELYSHIATLGFIEGDLVDFSPIADGNLIHSNTEKAE